MTVEMRDITGIKRVAEKLYAIIDNGDKQVVDSSLSDKRDTVVSYKTVHDSSLVEVTGEECSNYIAMARHAGVLPESLPSRNETIWVVSFTGKLVDDEVVQCEKCEALEEELTSSEYELDKANSELSITNDAFSHYSDNAHNEIERLKAQLATLQEALDTTVTHMAQENARLQEGVEQWEAVSAPPADYFEELEVRDGEILTLKAKLMLSKSHSSVTEKVCGWKEYRPITYEVYLPQNKVIEITNKRGGWRVGRYGVRTFDTAVDAMKFYIETRMNGEVSL